MPPAATCDQAITSTLTHDPREVSRARRMTRATLARWGLAERADTAQLIVSELVTNSIRHGTGAVLLTLAHTATELRIDVHDDGPGRPNRQHASAADEGGRGLDLVDTLARLNDGTLAVLGDSDGPGKTVGVTLRLPPGP